MHRRVLGEALDAHFVNGLGIRHAPHASPSLRRVIEDLDFEIDVFSGLVREGWPATRATSRCRTSPGSGALDQCSGVDPDLALVGFRDVDGPGQLADDVGEQRAVVGL
jgi:hypothetical protein